MIIVCNQITIRNYCVSTLLTAGAGGFSPGPWVAQAKKSVPPTQASEFAHVTRLAGTLGNVLVGHPFFFIDNLVLRDRSQLTSPLTVIKSPGNFYIIQTKMADVILFCMISKFTDFNMKISFQENQ